MVVIQDHPKRLTSFGRNNTVDVETAMIVRRVTSADTETLRPATAEQLKFRQSMLPRNTHSAKVTRKREMMTQLSRECFSNKCAETKFQDRVPLVHLGIDLKVDSEPVTAVTATGQRPLKRPPTAPFPSLPRCASSDHKIIFEGFVAAKEASQAMSAVDNLAPSVVQSNPYLQHLRSNAESALRDAADVLISVSRRNASRCNNHNNVPSSKANQADEADADGQPDTTDIPPHYRAVFEEWEQFLTLCRASAGDLDGDTQRELFVSFMRTRGDVPIARQPDGTNSTLPAASSSHNEADVKGHLTPKRSTGAEALDDLAPPSGVMLDPAMRPMTTQRTRTAISTVSVPLQRAKMMMDVHSKQEHLERLMELSMLSSMSGSRASDSRSPPPPGEGSFVDSPLKSPSKRRTSTAKSMDEVQDQAREVFAHIRNEHKVAHVNRIERQLERHQQLGLRLSRSKNIELYRLHQLEQHHRGLAHASPSMPAVSSSSPHPSTKERQCQHATTTALSPTAEEEKECGDNSPKSRLPSASLRSGPPSATHKLGGKPRIIGSARSRPSSCGTNVSTPRGPSFTLDLPTIPVRSAVNTHASGPSSPSQSKKPI